VSWSVRLMPANGENPVSVPTFTEGGTYAIGGTSVADLNVTYNYSRVYRTVGFEFGDMDGRRAGDLIPQMEGVVQKLGTKRDTDYWAATPGNAGYALNILLGWAELYPNARFEIN